MADGGAISAAFRFLLVTLRHHWAMSIDDSVQFDDLRNTILTELNKIQDDLNVLREADKNVASMRFTRGIHLLATCPNDETIWREDLTSALDSAEQGYHRVKTVQEKILCFEIMCTCFLILRPPESALNSILHQMGILFEEKQIKLSLANFQRCVRANKHFSLTREDKELLEHFFSRVCGIIAACDANLDCYHDSYNNDHQASFRDLFATTESIKNVTDPSVFQKWKDIQVYQFSTTARIAGNAAHAVLPIVPILCGLTTFLSAGVIRPKKMGIATLNTIPLHLYDTDKKTTSSKPNLYHFRWTLLDLAHCTPPATKEKNYPLGRVSVTEQADGWSVEPKY